MIWRKVEKDEILNWSANKPRSQKSSYPGIHDTYLEKYDIG